MRRSLLRIGAAATALATGIALAACTSDDEGTDGNGSGDATSTATDSFPVSVPTTFGDIEIPEQPTRIVALGWGDADIALNLGVQPVGASDFLGFGGDGVSPWNEETYDESPEILSGGGNQDVDIEKIAALDPDLILNVKSASDQETYDQLSDENLDTADADVVVGFPIGITQEEFEDLGPWKSLGAVKEGHAIVADDDLSQAFSLGSPDSVLWALEQITPKLEDATS